MKKEKKYLVLGVALAVLVIAAIILRIRDSRSNHEADSGQPTAGINGAQAGSYDVPRQPSLNQEDLAFGSDDAKLKVFVYEDYSDQYSARLADTLEKIRQSYGQDLTVVVRPFWPGDSELSRQAALAVLCAGEQGKWKEMRALIFSQVKSRQFEAENIDPALGQLDLDEDDFRACLTNEEKSERIDKVASEAKGYGIIGTPTIFIGDEMVLGARPYEDYVDSNNDQIEGLKTMIERKLQR